MGIFSFIFAIPQYGLLQRMLIDARLKAGLKQADVAAKLGKPQSYVSKIERGERGMDVIEFLEIAEVVGFEPFAFLDEFKTTIGLNPEF